MNYYQVKQTAKDSDVSKALYALIERQAHSWEVNNFMLAQDDWHAGAVLVSPGGEWSSHELAAAMKGFHQDYQDLKVTIKNVFATADGSKVAVEWDWTVTRRKDGLRGTTADAIIADLKDGKILSWREYFDLSSSVEGS